MVRSQRSQYPFFKGWGWIETEQDASSRGRVLKAEWYLMPYEGETLRIDIWEQLFNEEPKPSACKSVLTTEPDDEIT
jgi:hypothetical protein